MNAPRVMTLTGFLHRFLAQHTNRPDRPFCFILGAGASRPSGISTGGELARGWLEEMWQEENFNDLSLEQWATPDSLRINGFTLERCADFYPEIYERRFRDHPEEGYAFLESAMEGKEPSYGYAVLAYLISETNHRIVITTNFDNWMADALSIHSTKFPLVIGHDALAGFAGITPRRPLIAKIHGAVGFTPKNTQDEIRSLPQAWRTPLEGILRRCTPIVVGYAGNDGSLMGFLEGLPQGVPDNVYWFVRTTGADPNKVYAATSQRVCEFVAGKNGFLIPIVGFDELFLVLYDRLQEDLKWPDLYGSLQARARTRETRFDEQIRHLREQLGRKPIAGAVVPTAATPSDSGDGSAAEIPGLLQDAASRLAKLRVEKPWWEWEAEASAEADTERRDAIYQAALRALPMSAPLLGNYALFLQDVRKDYERAEEFYRRALEAEPKHANTLGNYAKFLLQLGRTAEGLTYLRRAEEEINESPSVISEWPSLTIELLFYRAAHDRDAWPSILHRIKESLQRGERAPGWPLDANVRRAEADGHPHPELLRALAHVIADGEDIAILSAFPEWVSGSIKTKI